MSSDVRSGQRATAEEGNRRRPVQADDLSGSAPTTGRLWPIPVAGDYLETLSIPVDPEWILEKPGRRFGYCGLPDGAGAYERVQVIDVKPEDGVVMVTAPGRFTVLRYFAECRWPDDGPTAEPAPKRDSNARTWCPECGPRVDVDEDGLCLGCGATACGHGADAACDALEGAAGAVGKAQPYGGADVADLVAWLLHEDSSNLAKRLIESGVVAGAAARAADSSSADEDEDRRWENEGGAALPDSSSDERTKPERFRSICVSINVRGVLEKSNAGLEEFFPGTLKRGARAVVDGEEIRSALLSELQLGHERLPIGKPCDRWDWKTGCRGHEGAAE
jgi:hypothetical protein